MEFQSVNYNKVMYKKDQCCLHGNVSEMPTVPNKLE